MKSAALLFNAGAHEEFVFLPLHFFFYLRLKVLYLMQLPHMNTPVKDVFQLYKLMSNGC